MLGKRAPPISPDRHFASSCNVSSLCLLPYSCVLNPMSVLFRLGYQMLCFERLLTLLKLFRTMVEGMSIYDLAICYICTWTLGIFACNLLGPDTDVPR